MAEHEDGGAEASSPAMTDSAGVAAALAVGLGKRANARAKDDPELDAFLREQTRLARLQSEHLHEQRVLVLSRLRWGRFSDRVKALLQVMTAVVGFFVALGIAAMAWAAHEDHGLVIDAFSVPPDLARDGLTGQVAASRFLDKLQAMQSATEDSDRPTKSYQSNWGPDIKVEIPETGLTLSEFEKLLRERIGHVDHVTGEVVKTPSGVAVTARLGDAPPQTFTGPAADYDALAQKAAEAVYRANQPYRYAEYLDNTGRVDEALQVIAELATKGPQSERGWAYAKWAAMELNDRGDPVAAARHSAMGIGYSPGSDLNARISQVNTEVWSGHEEGNLKLSGIIADLAQRRLPDTSKFFFQENKLVSRAWLLFVVPDYPAAAEAWKRMLREGFTSHYGKLAPHMAATAQALGHDPRSARATMATAPSPDERDVLWDVATGAFTALPNYWIAAEEGNWRGAFDDARAVDAALEAGKGARPIYAQMQKVWIWPLEALAQARSGDLTGARALIERTPTDCYLCLRVRGQIAAQSRDWAQAERWFAAAVRLAPSLPLAYAEWGRTRLDRGDADGAIALLKIAHVKTPRFADALETWGEALVAKRDYQGAIAQFQRAQALAPRWERNRLALARARALEAAAKR
jgi:tetratricopeptide (TPR) repeat protein